MSTTTSDVHLAIDHPAVPDPGGPVPRRPAPHDVATLGAAADDRATELRDGRRIPADLLRAAVDAGLFRQLVADDLGGSARRPLDWFRTGVELARHEASFAWVVTQGAAELAWIGAGADDGWAREVLADPAAVSASSNAGMGTLLVGEDHSRFGGRWRFNTGCHGATWIGGAGIVDGEVEAGGKPVIRWAWVPADRAEIIEDWAPSGLHGSGSHSTAIAVQEIETRWAFDPWSPSPNDRGPHRVVVGNGSWPIATSVAAVQLGNARRALDAARDVVLVKSPAPDLTLLAANAAVQRSLAEAEGLWHAALAGVERELDAMWDEALLHAELSIEQRVRLHRANLTATRLAVRVVDAVCEVTGTEAVAFDHVLARCQRDAHALRGHISIGAAAAEHNAKVALGIEPHHRVV
jgi:alkylation response protein AidB-like acyl-CoA dehydrogenase